MSESLKFIVSELNKAPFQKSYNLISFDSLEPLQRLQVLTDVLAEVDPKQKVDVREEAADQTAIRIFGILRILKYKPPAENSNWAAFRQGIVQGDKAVIHPILEWLLKSIPDLRKRAYLARYLVKIDIPPDFIADEQISELFLQYESLMGEFKEIHKQSEMLKTSGFNTSDIKKDIASMEDEKEQLAKRVERLKRKVSTSPNSGPMLVIARNLRVERDREERLVKQKNEQKNLIVQMEQRIQRMQQQIKDTKQASIGTTPQGLIQRLEEETKVNGYMVREQMPREIATLKKGTQKLQKIVAEPAMGQSDLDDINSQIHKMNAEVNQLIEKRMMSNDPIDDKLSLFRQQAAIIAHKKEVAAEALREVREELQIQEAEASGKRSQARQGDGEEVLKGEEFKRYVSKLRSTNTIYKKKRQEIAELRAEAGVLSRSEEILKGRDDTINQRLGKLEARQGVSGYRETQEALENVSAMKSEMDMMKGRTLEDISYLVQQLTKKIADKKSALAPIIKELRPLRQRAQELSTEYEAKKGAYDTMAAGLESNRSKLDQEVRAYREEISAEESRFHYLKSIMELNIVQQQRINNEMKAYVSSDPQEKKRAYREQYTRKIQEQENLGKGLREKQKFVRENQSSNLGQMRMWRDLHRLMEVKLHGGQGQGQSHRGHDGPKTVTFDVPDDRLVL
uniref:Intraflagellar transport protein 81 homolog n=1 Tax=Capitella teleta TaxID=283909 RepID=X1Z4C8_CAPTE